jgi:hypothetical protein
MVAAGQVPAPGRGGAAAALGSEQPGQEAKQFRGDIEHGTIGDHVESFERRRSVARPLLPGLHGHFRVTSGLSESLPERRSRAVNDRMSDPISVRSPH